MYVPLSIESKVDYFMRYGEKPGELNVRTKTERYDYNYGFFF